MSGLRSWRSRGGSPPVVIHEINNPLEAVSNLVYLIQNQPSTPESKVYLEMVDEQLRRISAITRETLTFNRTAQHPQSADLVELLGMALRTYDRDIGEKKLIMMIRLPESALCAVYPGELTQAFSNLISNAIDASEYGGKVHIRLKSKADRYQITVGDCGAGIPSTVRQKLFQAFASGKASGNGLGLWVSKRIVEKHGGHIRWRSSTGSNNHGTAFQILLANSNVPLQQLN